MHSVRQQYQDFPYPARDPEQERERLVGVFCEYLGELNHWLYGGKEDFNKGFRVLIAGGGTGDSCIYLAEQLKNRNAEIVYLDFSEKSLEIARKRAAIRNLTNITWVQESLLNLPSLSLGQFDYINCFGVLHHLVSPLDGLSILRDALKPGGGMGVMLYGKYGRTAIYQIQQIMKMVNSGAVDPREEIAVGRKLVESLPETNWFKKSHTDFFQEIKEDAGFYDLFLHKQDRAYSIPEVYELIGQAGLHFVEFMYFGSRALQVETYVKDPVLLQKIKSLSAERQQAVAELMAGNIYSHCFYLSQQQDTIATLEELDHVPYFPEDLGLANAICDCLEKHPALEGGGILPLNYNGSFIKNYLVHLPVSIYTRHLFKGIDNASSLSEIFALIRREMQRDLPSDLLLREARAAFGPFLRAGILLLRHRSIGPF